MAWFQIPTLPTLCLSFPFSKMGITAGLIGRNELMSVQNSERHLAQSLFNKELLPFPRSLSASCVEVCWAVAMELVPLVGGSSER